MIKNATITSVWDGGTEITTACKVDTISKEVFDVEIADVSGIGLDILTDEYISPDGEIYPVSADPIVTTYWYN